MNIYSKILLACFLLFFSAYGQSQTPEWSSNRIYHEIEKLQTVGSVLYFAAHPDDENTRLITWLANEKKLRTGYLSLTRGDGGQNLIGTEKGSLLGVLRTQELLEAREIDGGEQFFTRAVDFGYSKSSDETFDKWGKNEILADVVFAVRWFQPDVIITRFPPTSRAGHGHHQASAILAEEVIEAAADRSKFPEQLEFVREWQVKRLLHNTSTWWNKDLPEIVKNSDEYITVDIGDYNPLLGVNYSTIASRSRSQHRSQGFGAELMRGTKIEYLKHVSGTKAVENDVMDGIEHSWNRIPRGDLINEKIKRVLGAFDFTDPSKSVNGLLEVYQLLDRSPGHLKLVTYKKDQVLKTIIACSGIWAEALTEEPFGTRGKDIHVKMEVVNRSHLPIKLVSAYRNSADTLLNKELIFNEKRSFPITYHVALNGKTINPFWLEQSFANRFKVEEQLLRIKARDYDHYTIHLKFRMELEGDDFEFGITCPLKYKWVDRADGELYRPYAVMPDVTVTPEQGSLIFREGRGRNVNVIIKSFKDGFEGDVSLEVGEGWEVVPGSVPVRLSKAGEEIPVSFSVKPPAISSVSYSKVKVTSGKKIYERQLREIDYYHIEPQVVLLPAEIKMANVPFRKQKKLIGYIPGSGDDIPEALRSIGYEVESVEAVDLATSDLSRFETIISGIRAYNTQDALANGHAQLMNYVKNGGNYIVQYNTNRGLKSEIGPYPINLSRDRVTVENAPVHFMHRDHPILNYPNQINGEDFEGWVQERGLYFADEWDEHYTPLFSWNDPGEDPKTGSTLVTPYGKGTYIFTGISFFRQLPAGVPGAYRLFVNLIEYKQNASNGQIRRK